MSTLAVVLAAAVLLGLAPACTKRSSGGKKKTAAKKRVEREAPATPAEFKPIGEIEMTKGREAFAAKGWTPSRHGSGPKGELIEGEAVYTATDGPYTIRAKMKPVQKEKKRHLIGYLMFQVKGPALDLRTAEQIPAKIREVCAAIDPDFTKAMPGAITGMRTITGRGEPRKTGTAFVNPEWKCVVVNYIGERADGVLLVILEKKISLMAL